MPSLPTYHSGEEGPFFSIPFKKNPPDRSLVALKTCSGSNERDFLILKSIELWECAIQETITITKED